MVTVCCRVLVGSYPQQVAHGHVDKWPRHIMTIPTSLRAHTQNSPTVYNLLKMGTLKFRATSMLGVSQYGHFVRTVTNTHIWACSQDYFIDMHV